MIILNVDDPSVSLGGTPSLTYRNRASKPWNHDKRFASVCNYRIHKGVFTKQRRHYPWLTTK